MRYMHVNELRPGDRLGNTVYDKNGAILLTTGANLSTRSIYGLRERGFLNVMIDDEETRGIIIERPIKAELEYSILNNLMELDVNEVEGNAKTLVNDLLENNVKMTDIVFIKDYDNYTYQHSLSVGYMAAVCGMAAGFTRKEIENLTCAGLLHDIGKIKIDKDIINAPRRLTPEEYSLVQTHSKLGFDMLQKENYSVSSTAKVAVYEHHENEDGSGYPRGLAGKEIHKFAQIIHLCDVFDALTSDRSYRSPMARTEALEFIRDNTGTMFNPFYSVIFLKVTPPYPTGSIVEIATNRRGVVVANNINDLYNPLVRIIGTGEDIRLEVAKMIFAKKDAI